MQPKRRIVLTALIIAALVLIPVGVLFSQSKFNVFPQLIASNIPETGYKLDFPYINTQKLSVEQQNVITILKTEYALNPSGTKYSEGVQEAWCANFISWVFNEAGVPLSNPNTGSWRIPGTHTLREYYESVDKFQAANSGYTPKVGDVMLYDNPSHFGQHANIIIQNDEGLVTTIGGNEPGGIRIFKHKTPDKAGFIGYGVF